MTDDSEVDKSNGVAPSITTPAAVRKAEKAAGWYLKNPVVRALTQLIPGGVGGAVDVFIASRHERMLEERRRTFFGELDRGTEQLSAESIESDEFLHCFDITLRVVHRTHRKEKIRLFAKLFKAATSRAQSVSVDDYEELLRIFDDLSVRDLKVLMALEQYEAQYYKDGRFSGIVSLKECSSRSQHACSAFQKTT